MFATVSGRILDEAFSQTDILTHIWNWDEKGLLVKKYSTMFSEVFHSICMELRDFFF